MSVEGEFALDPEVERLRARSALLRHEARSLRSRSTGVRRAARRLRGMASTSRVPHDHDPMRDVARATAQAPLTLLDGVAVAPAGAGGLFDPVPVIDLFAIFVDGHGLPARLATELLVAALGAAGYPSDVDVVSASDALDIVDSVLRDG